MSFVVFQSSPTSQDTQTLQHLIGGRVSVEGESELQQQGQDQMLDV